MRPAGRKYVADVAKLFKIKDPIYEFGSLQVPGQEDLADLRPLFQGHTYVGCDFRAGKGVDLILDVEDIMLKSDSVGTVICVDTLEHVKNVYKATSEFHRILTTGGLLVLVSVMNFPIHEYPFDYWRFTPTAFELLLSPFKQKQVLSDGHPQFPTGVYGWGIK